MIKKKSIFRKIIRLQIVVLIIATALLYSTIDYFQKLSTNHYIEVLKNSVQHQIEKNFDEWASLYMLNLTDALVSELEPFKLKNNIEDIQFFPKDFQKNLSEYSLYIENHYEDKKNSALITFNKEEIRKNITLNKSSGLIVLMILITSLFLSNFLVYFLVKKKILSPLNELLKIIYKKSNNYERISAEGEIELFIKKFKNYSDQIRKSAHQEALVETASSVAHDIKSPTTTLKILLSKNKNTFSKSEYLIFHSSLKKILNISNDLLKDQKLFVNKKIESTPTHTIENSLLELLNEKKVEYIKKKIVFHTKFDNSLDHIDIDTNSFIRVASNLINNAIQACSNTKNPQIMVKVSNKIFSITDNGVGIPLEIIDSLENNLSLSSTSNGNGIGLQTASKFIKNHSGKILINRLNKGTIVSLIFS